ncbi:MAG TPA: NADH-quinone oxidoreductase subunit C [Rhizomicrobium sp.]|jgi:Ni,Fe-hydrogenase III large subunit|nr:NADH-quinone oxidoreductase subunit C [Rhizomicrobium sp.]
MTTPAPVSCDASELHSRAHLLLQQGGRMQMAYAWYPEPDRAELRYLASRGPGEPFEIWRVGLANGSAPSLAQISPLLGWYEREITDLFGVTFRDHPEPKRLVLHEGADPGTAPFSPAYPPGRGLVLRDHPDTLPEMEAPDVQRLPWGPVRADVVESGEFVFYYIGEHIIHLHPQLFFKHRGMEKRFEGLTPESGVVWAERVSGVGSFAHALAYCQAVEAAGACDVPRRARLLRTLLAEMERLYNHLHYLGHLADTTTLKVAAAQGKYLEERAKQLNGKLTGSRFLRGLVTPGGMRRDIEPGAWLAHELDGLHKQIEAYTRLLGRSNSYLDRLMTTGVLEREVAFDQGATGPVERASGIDRDLRRDHPYAAYGEAQPAVARETAGDAYARARVRMAETEASLALILRILPMLETGPVRAPCAPVPNCEGLGWAETPRGSLFYAVHFGEDARLRRVKIKSPSFSNWRVFPFTVHGSNMMDYAINEASFGLTIAGCDR